MHDPRLRVPCGCGPCVAAAGGGKGKLWGKVRVAVDEGHQAVVEKPRLLPDLHRRRAALQRKREVRCPHVAHGCFGRG